MSQGLRIRAVSWPAVFRCRKSSVALRAAKEPAVLLISDRKVRYTLFLF